MNPYDMTKEQRIATATDLLDAICELDGARGLDSVVDTIAGSTFSELIAACE